jgi:SAM-dependent methyltransferase
MSRLLRLWKDQYGVTVHLDADSWARIAWNHCVVAPLLNAFPKTARKILARSRSELMQLLFADGEGGSFRVLQAMYKRHNPHRTEDILHRLIMQSPGIKGIRNRRHIAQHMLEVCLDAQPHVSPALVLAVGGGDGRIELEVIARTAREGVYYCGVDRDDRAEAANQQVLKELGLDGRGFVVTGASAEDSDLEAVVEAAQRRFGVRFDGAAVTVCHGITEYMDVGQTTNASLGKLLTALYRCTRPEGTLLISQGNNHDRVKFLEEGLSWHMRLRSKEELEDEVTKAGWQVSVCEQEPMKVITMCMAVKSDGQRLRIDRREQLARHRLPASVPASRHRRAAMMER